MRNKLSGFLFLVILLTAVLGGWYGDRVKASGPAEPDVEALLETFSEAFEAVQRNYAKKVESEELVESAIRGMLRTLDPHSSYFAAPDYNKLQEEQQGQYYGLGILIRPERPGTGRVLIVEPPSPGTPGNKAGLRPGDVISKIHGEPIDDWTYPDEIIPKLKGPKGTKVQITVERPGQTEPLEIEIERDAIPLYTIKFAFHVQPGIGYIRIDRFSESTSDELDDALERLDEQNMKGLLLDLRNNPGGSLRQAIEVSDRFLERGQLIVSTRGRSGKGREFRAPRGRRHDYPMVVLINRYSASASEIVSGALQDHDRALIVGETSFGKALVQTVYPMNSDRGLALTTGKYYTPSNRLIQRPYGEGFYDYYYNRDDGSAAGGEAFSTDSGRKVFGGGGIGPDVEVEPDRFPRLAGLVNRRNLFYNFAGKLTRGDIESDIQYQYDPEEIRELGEDERDVLMAKLPITEKTLGLFREFLDEQKIEVTDEDFEESREIFSNRLRQEIFLIYFGERDGARVALTMDNQVQKAIELLPQAQKLLKD